MKKLFMYIFQPKKYGALYRPCNKCKFYVEEFNSEWCSRHTVDTHNVITGVVNKHKTRCAWNRCTFWFGSCTPRGLSWQRK